MLNHRREWRQLADFQLTSLRSHSLRSLRWLVVMFQELIKTEGINPPVRSDPAEEDEFLRRRRRALELMQIEIAWREKWWWTLGLLRTALFEPRDRRMQGAPGMDLARIMRFLMPRRSYERLVEQVIADSQVEYFEALSAGDEWHARWIAIRVWVLVIPGWFVGIVKWIVKLIVAG